MKKQILIACMCIFISVFISCQTEEIIGNDSQNIIEDNDIQAKSLGVYNIWTNGNIYYQFDNTVQTTGRNSILNAMTDWHYSSGGSVTFIERTNQSNYVIIYYNPDAETSSSSVGMSSGVSTIVFNEFSNYITRHELGHIIGLWHEHQKPNRDLYININWSDPFVLKYQGNYTSQCFNVYYSSGFDFSSVMLGGSGGKATKKDGSTWNVNSTISSQDGQGVYNLYHMPSSTFSWVATYYPMKYATAVKTSGGKLTLTWNLATNATHYLILGYISTGTCWSPYYYADVIGNNYIINANSNYDQFLKICIVPVSNYNITSSSNFYTIMRSQFQ
jgi:hypothetical protein